MLQNDGKLLHWDWTSGWVLHGWLGIDVAEKAVILQDVMFWWRAGGSREGQSTGYCRLHMLECALTRMYFSSFCSLPSSKASVLLLYGSCNC